MTMEAKWLSLLVFSFSLLAGCAYNPLITNNHTTGSATGTLVGAAAGAGSVALLGGSKPLIVLAGLGGGAIGYYVTTLRYDAGGVIQSGGQAYKIGDFVGIDMPADKLFEPNTADFLPQAAFILDSAATVLQRYPNNNILISGNSSGFAGSRWERRLSEKRAQRVSAYLWNAGISQFKENSNTMRKLNYVGYGDYFPIANHYTNESIRKNSHIQITSYPSSQDLYLDKHHAAFRNMGADNDNDINDAPPSQCGLKDEC